MLESIGTLVLVLILIFGTIDVALALYTQTVVNDAAQIGARVAKVQGPAIWGDNIDATTPVPTEADIDQAVQASVQSQLALLAVGQVQLLSVTILKLPFPLDTSPSSQPYHPDSRVTVTVQARYFPITALGLTSVSITFRSASTIVI